MAVLQKIRSKGTLLIIVIAFALFAFIIGDLINSGVVGKNNADTIGEIDGTKVNREMFAQRIQNITKGGQTSEAQAAEQLWNQEIRNAVLNNQIDEAGLEVSDKMVSDQVKLMYGSVPQFQENGQFSEAALYKFVADLKKNDPARHKLWLQDVDNAANSIKQQLFFSLVQSGFTASNASGKFDYHLENDVRNFSYVSVPYTSIDDKNVKISNEEIREYLKAHEDSYQTEAKRDLDLVYFQNKASDEDIAAIRTELNGLLDDGEVFNKNTNNTEQRIGFRNAENAQAFANSYSEQKSVDTFMPVTNLPAEAQSLSSVEVGTVVGPYVDGEYLKASKLLERKVVMDSVKNRHILFAYAGAQRAAPTVTRTKEEAKKVADSVFALIGQTKSAFEDKYAYYQVNTEDALAQDIGWLVGSGNASGFDPAYAKWVLDNPAGQIGLVESSFGYHIIRNDETAAPTNSVRVATISKKLQSSKETDKELYNKVQKFQMAAEKEKLADLAKKYDQTVVPAIGLGTMSDNLPTIGQNRAVVRWAFEEERSKGDVERFEVPGGFIVAKVTKVTEKGLMTASDARATVEPILRNKKKAEMIKKKMNGKTLEEIASANKVSVQQAIDINRKNPSINGSGMEPRVVGTAFGLKINSMSKPIAGSAGVFVVKPTSQTIAPDIANYKNEAMNQAQQAANQATSLLVEALKKKIDIVDNRGNIY